MLTSACSDGGQSAPIETWYRLELNLGVPAAIGGPCHAAERPIRWADRANIRPVALLPRPTHSVWRRRAPGR